MERVLGQLVFTAKGKWWVCYYGWNGGVELSRVKLKEAEQNNAVRRAFMELNILMLKKATKAERAAMAKVK